MYDLNNFCNIIAMLRREKGWSQVKLAEMIGISPQSISKWECGIGFPDVTLFPVLAETLSVPIGFLFGEENKKEDTIMEKNQILTEYREEFEVCQNIKVSLGNLCRVEVIDGEMEKALVRAVGDPTFMRYFSVEKEPERLYISIKNPTGSAFLWQPYDREGYEGENLVQIFTGLTYEDSMITATNYLNLRATSRTNSNGNHEVEVTVMPDENKSE